MTAESESEMKSRMRKRCGRRYAFFRSKALPPHPPMT